MKAEGGVMERKTEAKRKATRGTRKPVRLLGLLDAALEHTKVHTVRQRDNTVVSGAAYGCVVCKATWEVIRAVMDG